LLFELKLLLLLSQLSGFFVGAGLLGSSCNNGGFILGFQITCVILLLVWMINDFHLGLRNSSVLKGTQLGEERVERTYGNWLLMALGFGSRVELLVVISIFRWGSA